MERFTLAALLVVVVPSLAVAQRVTITPQVGAYVPLTNQGKFGGPLDCGQDPCGESWTTLALEPGITTGLGVGVEWDGRVGFEASLATTMVRRRFESASRSSPATGDPAPHVGHSDTRNTVAAVVITLAQPIGRQADLSLGAGLACTWLSGERYESGEGYEPYSARDRSIIGPSLAATLGIAVTSRTRVEIGVSHRLYSFEFANRSPRERTSFMQHDLVLSSGIGFVLGR